MKLEKQLANVQAEASRNETRYRDERASRERNERRLTAQRGLTTRMKNRMKLGKCVCCQKEFSNIAAHMKTDHPKFPTQEN
jgi:phage terminase Nu1 subunit (DNA packaging protein)